ncbi:mannitol dehydrogenase family protein [Streptomyces durmitorensis]|uniref:Mannitol dehydrogenase family protein n=1 Tax=Streptomyces durmitorensis TaxID=319947 RepID=A0ABY4PP97_9ACTN|nr:mannitol dehydrogenase family protein [Streptomyces durmitorensis]UQT55620.1 mannitol dehydrogenase family protein [Streptomyces durmitorensis]
MADLPAPGNALPRLARSRLPVPGIKRPPRAPEAGIVHLGLGNFHRAHQAVYTADALRHAEGPWGIRGVATGRGRSGPHPVIEGMSQQDELYTVLTLSQGSGPAAQVPGVHHRGLVAAHQTPEVIEAIASDITRIVSLTVTEKGYSLTADGSSLDLDDPAVRADLAGRGDPMTAIGLLVRGLQHRMRGQAAPVTLLSCDNLMDNGGRLRALLDAFIGALPAPERTDLQAYLAASVSTPSTMVDRIVPATTDEHRALAARCFGVRDTVPVVAEPYRLWVLEDDFRASRPAWEEAGAVFTSDVAPYELMKLRLLNGAHSLLAYFGLLRGLARMDQAVADASVGAAVRAAMTDEILPTLTLPEGVNGPAYVAELLRRFANPALGHRTAQVGSDGSLKIPVRWAGAIEENLAAGRVPTVLALGVAAYIKVVTGGPDAYDEAALGVVADPAAARLRKLAARAGGPAEAARILIESGGLLPEQVAGNAEFTSLVAEYATALGTPSGIEAALREVPRTAR